ncbi:hypothetical protein BN997_02139 [Oceanobacillus oncorhynchi]|uniref:Major Facilitator Superfamily protein n=2 Tax=Oceanobacillus TaxID=182709 RepID=A0A0A1MRH7_9BACI|nr:hypothetical protein BN997_02139 [Oceanobacillus oncorhynchi]
MGLYNGLWGLGGLAGMLAGGFLADQLPISFVTTLFALAAVAVFPFIFKLVPKNNTTAEKDTVAVNRHVPEKEKQSIRLAIYYSHHYYRRNDGLYYHGYF